MADSAITTILESRLAAGVGLIGEIAMSSQFALLHQADAGRQDLQLFHKVEDARELARFDDHGAFRPLKTAPNLRRGWRLELRDADEMRAALDFFYPAMLGILLAHEKGRLEIVPLRETLNRQSGMYAVTRRITDGQADDLIGGFCRSAGGCLKTVLWPLEPGVPVSSLPAAKFDPGVNQLGTGRRAIPLLCHEACNLLVAAAREKVKSGSK